VKHLLDALLLVTGVIALGVLWEGARCLMKLW